MRHLTLRALVFAFGGDSFRVSVPAWILACTLQASPSIGTDWCARGEVEALLEGYALPKGRALRLPTCPECAGTLGHRDIPQRRVLAEMRAHALARMRSAGVNVEVLV